MELQIVNKKVLITGASRGIGRACAIAFAQEGASVTAVARTETALCSLIDEINVLAKSKGFSSHHYSFVADLLEKENPEKVATLLLDKYGPYDIVVHAVGGSLVGSREPTAPMEEWQRAWMFNCGIAIAMNHHLIPPMREKKWGRVIHISSISAVMLRGSASYASAKAYLNAYTTTVGRLLAQDNVIVSAIMPGAVAFEGSYWDNYVKEGHPRVHDFLSHHQAIGRFGTPEEIASFVLLLGSERAGFASGSVIPVDGGNM